MINGAKRFNTGVHRATHDLIFARTSGGPGAAVHAGVESLGAVDHPAVTVAFGAGLKPGGVRAVLRLGRHLASDPRRTRR
ncbi:hypothetical protein MAHJHV63_49960 [Mycobacterium avium subsp. hominissuis]